ncbi:uncharacterized protein METZ01_LOCUS111663, partial [marine metagenome]
VLLENQDRYNNLVLGFLATFAVSDNVLRVYSDRFW